jgi:hypothetical protein
MARDNAGNEDIVATLGTSDKSLRFTFPASQAGIVNFIVNGQTSYTPGIANTGNLVAGSSYSWSYLIYRASHACIEMVPFGAEPSYCTPFVQQITYSANPAGFYASTHSGSVGGYIAPRSDGTLDFSSVSTRYMALLIPDRLLPLCLFRSTSKGARSSMYTQRLATIGFH